MDDFKQPTNNNSDSFDGEKLTPPSEQPTPMPPASEPLKVQKKSGAKKWLLWGAVVILLAAAGAFGYLQWVEAQNLRDELKTSQDQLKVVQDANKTDAKTEEESDKEDKPTDKERITEVVTAHAQAPTASKSAKVTVNIMKQGTEFAYVSVGMAEGGGYATILKKVNDEWVVIFRGQEKPDKTTIDQYSIPTEYQSGQ